MNYLLNVIIPITFQNTGMKIQAKYFKIFDSLGKFWNFSIDPKFTSRNGSSTQPVNRGLSYGAFNNT